MENKKSLAMAYSVKKKMGSKYPSVGSNSKEIIKGIMAKRMSVPMKEEEDDFFNVPDEETELDPMPEMEAEEPRKQLLKSIMDKHKAK